MAARVKTKLLLSQVNMRNFRAYHGNISVDFSTDPKRTITIIHGEMGLGKTTMLDGIYWCLYGEERSKKGTNESGEGIVNTNVFNEMNAGDKDTSYVEIFLHDEDGIRYKIKREITFSKDSDSNETTFNPDVGGLVPTGFTFKEKAEFNFLKSRGGDADWEVTSDLDSVQERIGQIFPKILSSYFLFDAELLNEFFYSEAEEHVKNGIEKISGLPIMETASYNLQKTGRDIEKQVAEKNVSTKPLADEIAQYDEEIIKFSEQLKKGRAEINKIKKDKKGLEEYLRQHDDQEISTLQTQIDSLNGDIRILDKQLDDKEEEIRLFLLDVIPKSLLRETIEIAERHFQKHEDEERIPPTISKIALENILTSSPPTCICGTNLEENSKAKQKIESLKERILDSSLTQQITVGRSLLSNIFTNTESSKLDDEFTNMKSQRGQLKKFISDKKAKRATLQEKLDNHNIDDVQEKSRTLHALISQEVRLIGDNKQFESKIQYGKELIEKKRRELDTLTGKSNKYQSERNKAKLARTLSSIIEQTRKELVDEMRETVANITTKYFSRLVSKKDDFVRVEILPNYKTVAYDSQDKSKSLSAGQSCCLALSYIAAIREIANRDYFMMIDSPLHNISALERVGIANNLPAFIPGTQISLLVQDQEYTSKAKTKITGDDIASVRETLRNNDSVWREYLLESERSMQDNTSNTKIRLLNDFSGVT